MMVSEDYYFQWHLVVEFHIQDFNFSVLRASLLKHGTIT